MQSAEDLVLAHALRELHAAQEVIGIERAGHWAPPLVDHLASWEAMLAAEAPSEPEITITGRGLSDGRFWHARGTRAYWRKEIARLFHPLFGAPRRGMHAMSCLCPPLLHETAGFDAPPAGARIGPDGAWAGGMSSSTSLPLLLVAASTALFLGCAPGAPADGVHREALSAAHDGQTYVVVGERWDFNAAGPSRPLLFSSPDASDFTARDDGLPAVPLNAVAHGSGVFLAVGGQLYQDPGGSDFKESSTALFSADGQTWTEAQGIPSEALVGVAFGEGTFVAVGKDGSTFRSQDGQSLTPGPKIDGFAIVHGVAFGAGKFVVYGEGSSVFVSSDGTSFSQVPTPVDDAYLDFAGGAFRGAGAAGFSGEDPGTMKNLYSADGLTWSGGAADAGVGAMAEMNGTFIGVTAGEILRSSDAQGWTSLGTFDENHWRYDVIAAGGKFVVVGRNEVSVSEDGETFESIPLD